MTTPTWKHAGELNLSRPTRREFGLASALAAQTIWLAAPRASALPIAPVIIWVRRFASAVGAAVVADLITDYIRNKGEESKRNIEDVNSTMAAGGFTNLTESTVYKSGESIFYPAINEDNFNTCVAFIRKTGSVGMIEGPTVVGLSAASQAWSTSAGKSSTFRHFFPLGATRQGDGRFSSDYSGFDELRTSVGRVQLNYKHRGGVRERGWGTVAVLGERRLGTDDWETFFDRAYDVGYQTT